MNDNKTMPLRGHDIRFMRDTGKHEVYTGLYVNDGGIGVSLVAIVDKVIGNWAAYCGASHAGGNSEEVSVMHALNSGIKLPRDIAERFFPTVAANYEWRS